MLNVVSLEAEAKRLGKTVRKSGIDEYLRGYELAWKNLQDKTYTNYVLNRLKTAYANGAIAWHYRND